MDLRMYWIVRNGAFAAALYFAMVEHVGWLMYAIGAFAWWLFASAAWAMSDPSTSPTETDAPLAYRTAFDAAVLVSLFAAHWYWTAFAYALSCGCSAMVQARATSKP